MKFKIPTQYQMGGRTIKVITVEKSKTNGVKAHGNWFYRKGVIEIEEKTMRNKEHAEFVFFHEMIRSILTNISEDALNANEDFVNRFAGSLQQAIKTME